LPDLIFKRLSKTGLILSRKNKKVQRPRQGIKLLLLFLYTDYHKFENKWLSIGLLPNQL
jgi:hypothetical protein